MISQVDTGELVQQVKAVYRQVALRPWGGFHFPLGRALAERLGYPAKLLEQIPSAALDSFAGVGYALDLAGLTPGQRVLDLGCGSGADTFAAAVLTGPSGQVTGVDMTDAQLAKAVVTAASARRGTRLRHGRTARRGGHISGGSDRRGPGQRHIAQLRFALGRLEDLPFPDADFDVVISNGAISLCPDKTRVFEEVARVLAPGGRLALADVITTRPLRAAEAHDVDLWSARIGGAAYEPDYRAAITAAGLEITDFRVVPQYRFLTTHARDAARAYGVRAVTLAAGLPYDVKISRGRNADTRKLGTSTS
jgi:arsenite methyltransferase